MSYIQEIRTLEESAHKALHKRYQNAISLSFLLAACSAVTGYIAGKESAVSSTPYIGCDFADRDLADSQREQGTLSKNKVYEACHIAVDRYFNGKRPYVKLSTQIGDIVSP